MAAAPSDPSPSPYDLADRARDLAEDQKSHGAERLGGFARAVHSAATEIERDLPQAAGYIHEAADRLQRASSAVRNQSIEEIIAAIDDFARRQPVAFFGGSVLAGFVLSRFLKSTTDSRAAAPARPHEAPETDHAFPPSTERPAAGGE
jgi:hypothetical protein